MSIFPSLFAHGKGISLILSLTFSAFLQAQSQEDIMRLLNNVDLDQLGSSILERAEQPDRLFYFPTSDEPATPAKWKFSFESVNFSSADGTKLHGWFIHPKTTSPRGTVVFSHGNAGSIGHHIGYAAWLVDEGYQLFMYDYRGFGKSEGKIDRKGIVEDVAAAFRYVKSRNDVDSSEIISLGHSLGGAKSVTAIAATPVNGLKAVIVDGTFASYKEMATLLAGELGSGLISDDLSPQDYIRKIAPTPFLVIHGDKDQIVPISQGRALFQAAAQPKTFIQIQNGKHENTFTIQNGAIQKRVLSWLNKLD